MSEIRVEWRVGPWRRIWFLSGGACSCIFETFMRLAVTYEL